MRELFFGLLGACCITLRINAVPGYTLSSPPYVVTNYGSVISGQTIDRTALFTLSGNNHFISTYIGNYGSSPIQIVDVNFTTGTARLTNSSVGRATPMGYVLYSNGIVYQTTFEANGKGFLFSYNPSTGQTRQIAQTSQYVPQYNDIGDDGWIYIGEYPEAWVDRYDPATDTFQSLGNMETDTNGNFGSYAYYVGADTRYLFVTVGESPWYLVVYDTLLTTLTPYWKTAGDTVEGIRHGTNGLWYYYRENSTNANLPTWYVFTSGIPVPIATGLVPSGALRGHVIDGVANSKLLGYNVNLDAAIPNTGSNVATIAYKLTNAVTWSYSQVSGFSLDPFAVFLLYPWEGINLVSFGFTYGPIFKWNTITHSVTTLGYPPNFDVYGILAGSGYPPSVAYISAYSAGFLRYAPSNAWTLSYSSTNFFSTNVNPYQTGLVLGEHNYYEAFGSDGMVYVAAEEGRKGPDGYLGWYDPATGTNGYITFTNNSPNDLKPALNATKLVYLSTTSSNLWVFDVASKTVERTVPIIIGGVSNLDKVIEVSPGVMFGDAGRLSASSINYIVASNIFTVDVTTGTLLSTNTLSGATAFALNSNISEHRMVLGPDGYIWMPVNNSSTTFVYRINPTTGSSTNVFSLGYYYGAPASLMFNGSDMYLYGTTNLYEVNGLLAPSPRARVHL